MISARTDFAVCALLTLAALTVGACAIDECAVDEECRRGFECTNIGTCREIARARSGGNTGGVDLDATVLRPPSRDAGVTPPPADTNPTLPGAPRYDRPRCSGGD